MNNNAKRALAFWIAVIMLVGMFPTVVFAVPPNPGSPDNDRPMMQNPVFDPHVMFHGRGAGNIYNLNIQWTRPLASTVPHNTNVLVSELPLFIPDIWTLFPTRYDVIFRNASLNEPPGTNPLLPTIEITESGGQPLSQARGAAPLRGVSTGNRTFSFMPNSLYEIQIEPRRLNPHMEIEPNLMDPTLPPTRVPSGQPAPIDEAAPQPRRNLLFLSDVEIEAEGRGNTITITWENPTWGGQNVFEYWEITNQPFVQGQPITAAGRVLPVVTELTAPGNQILLDGDGMLSIAITDPTIAPLTLQSVRVEPMLGPNPGNQLHRVRTRDGAGATIPFQHPNIPGLFNLAFSPQSAVEYRADVLMIPELHIEQLGVDFIRLWWSHLGALAGGGAGLTISHVLLEEWPPEMEGEVPPAGATPMRPPEILGGAGFLAQMNEWLIGPGIPRIRRGFALAIVMDDGTIHRTNVVVHDPLQVNFSPYRPDIINIAHEGYGRISMEWLAFARYPAVFEEHDMIPEGDPYNGRFVDTAIEYEIFVSDSWSTLLTLTTPLMPPLNPLQLQAGRRINPVEPPPPTPQYDPTFALLPGGFITEYQTMTPQGIQISPIQGNQVYFVRIRAVRNPGGQTSDWAFGSIYVPPLDGIPVTPEMIGAPPVRVDHDNVTDTTIPIFWDVRYLEIMQYNPRQDWAPNRDVWHTVVGVDRRGEPIFGRSATHINYVIGENAVDPGAEARHRILNELVSEINMRNRLLGIGPGATPLGTPMEPTEVGYILGQSLAHVQAFLSGLGLTSTTPTALRIQDMSNVRYQIHVVSYDDMNEIGGLDVYREGGSGHIGINNDPSVWTSIGQPTVTEGVVEHVVTGLQPNTSYVIFVRPYIVAGGVEIPAYLPTFVIGTTITQEPRPIPDPTTPVLIVVPRFTGRNTVGVRWRVQSNMIYNIHISHFFTDYSDGGTVIPLTYEHVDAALNGGTMPPFEEPFADFTVQEVDGVPYFHLQIFERFPFTTYYIWAVAMGVDEEGEVATSPSAPSNPVDVRTLDIEPPPPPRSFGRAPQTMLNIFNRYNDTEYMADEPYALTLSWMRIFADLRDITGELTERAEEGEGDGDIRPLNLPNLDVTEAYVALHMLRFEELVANRRYYARARTILTVTRGEADVYSYEIELADNEDFLDSVTFTIPVAEELDPINMRRAMSEWVYIEIDTGVSDDEFDGVHRPDQFPLPERDFEITYDAPSQTLTWRFRTNQRGADGRLDQNVDQRFITRLIQSRVFTFTIDMSQYEGMPISNREIILPESILRAFGERRISLEILTGDTNIIIPPGALDTAQMRNMQPGIGTYHHITINNVMTGTPPLSPNTSFATVPQRFSVRASTPSRTETLNTFAQPVQVILPVERFTTPEGLSTALFVNDTNAATWRDTQGALNFSTNALSSTINAPTTFAAVTRSTPQAAQPAHPTNQAMQRVSSRLTITDMQTFNPNQVVTANEFNNIVNALVNNRATVTLGANLSAGDTRSLTNARLIAPANFTRENAIDIMVRLYENRTRQILTPMTPAASVPGIQNTAPATHRNMRIAADIGFIVGPLEPQGSLTMGELINMVDIIIQDSGM